jgi:serine/threonine protein kinase
LIILIFAPIVPNTPQKTLVAALVAASMGPVSALVWKSLGHQTASPVQLLLEALPSYLCAGVALVIAHIITRLGREVRKAREMGSYVLENLIGKGGMGEVWQATHRFLVRPAAIKLIKPEVLGAATQEQAGLLVQRFKREARAAAMLRSPHTIQLYDFGVAGDGTFYYVMELLNGMDLQSLVTRFGPLPPNRAVHLLCQACESLAEAHERGMVHRDIKPANIQVCRMGQYFDFVKVLDFGLVKTTAPTPKRDPGLTSPDLFAGTPAYLAPESATGEGVDQRADVYALGCVAYWMLTGRLVFDGDSPIQIVARHIQATPEPPSRYSPFPLPPALEETVLACLAKLPEDRPANVGDLAERLAHSDVESPWTREDARRWWETSLESAPSTA